MFSLLFSSLDCWWAVRLNIVLICGLYLLCWMQLIPALKSALTPLTNALLSPQHGGPLGGDCTRATPCIKLWQFLILSNDFPFLQDKKHTLWGLQLPPLPCLILQCSKSSLDVAVTSKDFEEGHTYRTYWKRESFVCLFFWEILKLCILVTISEIW